jgi:pimeloyl-ACP methyl ester carboxylesterase
LFGGTADGSELPRESVFAPPDDPKALRDSLSTVLSGAFREAQPDVVEAIADWRADEDADRRAWETHTAALAGFAVTGRLYECTRPTLVVHGGADRTVPADAGRRLAEGLPRGRVETFEGAGHLVGVERSRPVNDLLIGHLDEHDDV